jgi:uncharacterized membrane protein YdjX (TVP38/TMEM64 family)
MGASQHARESEVQPCAPHLADLFMSGAEKPAAPPFRRWLPLGILVAGLILFLVFGGNRYLSFDMLRQHRDELVQFVAAHSVAAPLCFVLAYTCMIAFSLPGALLMTVLGGFLFGTYLGAACSVIGASAGATLLFLAARTSVGAILEARAGPFLHKMEEGFQRNALSYLLVLRLVPLFPFWLVNLVPAFLNVPLRTYVLGTVLGIIPGGLVFASIGSGLGEVLDAGRKPELDILFNKSVLLPMIGLAVLALIPVGYKMIKARKP